MKLHQIRAINALMQLGSVTQTARALNVSQPAISRTLRQLEEELGVDLFVNRNGRLMATPYAASLLPFMQRILMQFEELERHATELRDGKMGQLRIASAPSAILGLVEAGEDEFRRNAPNGIIDITTARTSNVVEMVSRGDADIGFCQLNGMENNIIGHISFRGAVVCVMPRDHPLAHKTEITVNDLKKEPLITLSPSELTGKRILTAFLRAGIRPNFVFQISQTLPAIQLAAAGKGIALVDSLFTGKFQQPTSFVQSSIFNGMKVIPFHPILPIDLQMITAANRPLPYLAEVFVDGILAKYAVN